MGDLDKSCGGKKVAFGGTLTFGLIDLKTMEVMDVDLSAEMPKDTPFGVTSVAFSADSNDLLYCLDYSENIEGSDLYRQTVDIVFWDLKTNKKKSLYKRVRTDQKGVRFVLSANEQEIVVREGVGTYKIHRVAVDTAKQTESFELPNSASDLIVVGAKREVVVLAYGKGVVRRGVSEDLFQPFLKFPIGGGSLLAKDNRVLVGGRTFEKEKKQHRNFVVDHDMKSGDEVVYETDDLAAGGIGISSDERYLALDVGYVTKVYELPKRSPAP